MIDVIQVFRFGHAVSFANETTRLTQGFHHSLLNNVAFELYGYTIKRVSGSIYEIRK